AAVPAAPVRMQKVRPLRSGPSGGAVITAAQPGEHTAEIVQSLDPRALDPRASSHGLEQTKKFGDAAA
ncbi:MAG: hypothetical protein ACYCZX_19290, partial [Rhodospirillaceae bacterium]